jgi:tRNA U34 5-carboxymethylaminomethyl modifying enzyme MnmG/GidA
MGAGCPRIIVAVLLKEGFMAAGKVVVLTRGTFMDKDAMDIFKSVTPEAATW